MWVEFETLVKETDCEFTEPDVRKMHVDLSEVASYIETSTGVELIMKSGADLFVYIDFNEFAKAFDVFLKNRNVTTFQNGAN